MASGEKVFPFGKGPALKVVDKVPLPEDVFKLREISTWKKWTTVYGPAVIVLGASIGSGEFLLGPNLITKFGPMLLWVCTISALFQLAYNYCWFKTTITTGEPAIQIAQRLGVWGAILGLALFYAGTIWPGWAATSAQAIAAWQLGRMPTAADLDLVRMWGYVLIILALVIVSVGGKISRTLEYWNWFDLFVILGGFIIFDIIFVPPHVWGQFLAGYVSFGYMPAGVDIAVLSALIGYTGASAAGNYSMSNYYRDKGYGTGSLVGYIPALIGGKKIKTLSYGAIPEPTPENVSVMKRWYRYMLEEQTYIFFVGAMIGMMVPSMFAYSNKALVEYAGAAAWYGATLKKLIGDVGWHFGLLCGVLTLYKTQIDVIDSFVRNNTDFLWRYERVRKFCKEDIRRLYYLILAIYLFWAAIAMQLAAPFWLIVISANSGNMVAFFWIPLLIWANRKLPKEYRFSKWLEVVLILMLIFCEFWFGFAVLRTLKIV
ncbi:MAG: hypothetical protein DSO07_05825 [Thermoproteota archaeon]|jgi:Mn2+/Fe2+ NRAMP family transporter|uniref:Divalent metal cation transporter n=1 Tax=Candidatus Methanodesulfokora washburnensis TaxID=2478471 RepID=A0A3R9QB44_9CREN|nr:Nramp family divalent metal transporter [Candidatus Methanodesulfokores washburnensis]RSN72210.1 hypothetical protein D6D85_14740 [Candidatus Methanodesulfokores washburnensis]RZN63579.1 MAG: hypothetical protein EF810_00565 [Candidatus Methanodesulfokores washburnensis]TDA41206.1 MAG: hypothetical protein DSO07_05825 [Candidatus Korarchaeota archaeon]